MSEQQTSGVVIITGGSSGIGLSTAQLFAQKGWRVGLIARGIAALDAAAESLAADPASVATAIADVTDGAALRQAAATIIEALGPVDVWINNAGVSTFAHFTNMSDEEFRRVTDVVYMGTVNGTRVALEQMRPRNAGTIVNVCSAIGLRGTPLLSAYSGAKWAMRGFTEAVRAELIAERSRVHISVVYPPSVNTPFYSHATARIDGLPRPPPPVYQPELVADAIHFAATSRRRDVLVGGQTVQLGLLNAVAPALADRLLASFGPRSMTSSNQGIADARDENLFRPTSRVSSTHGPFDREARSRSVQLWATKNRPSLKSALTFGAAVCGLMVVGRPR
ncbi:SDR family oxidoreductase [Lichenicola sp.]|uniref:SDR family oxidoreductase n=1 Tax=Lichenicola sp. TaxID=2804529 RepID=UPI003B00192E